MQTFVTTTSVFIAVRKFCVLHDAGQLCIVLYSTLCTTMCMHPPPPFLPESLPMHILEPCVHRVSANLL